MNCWNRPERSSKRTMADKPKIGLRYCGGCNPRYDRVAVVKRLEEFFPEAEFLVAEEGKRYCAVVVACGCSSRCANVSGLAVPMGRLVYLSGWEDLLQAKERLRQLLEGPTAHSLCREEVLKILPHRPPMLFVDEAVSVSPGAQAVATCYVDPAMPALSGHFPDKPVLPGIYAVEAMAQTADLMLLTLERYGGKTPLFMGIRKASFRKKILPGDTMEIHAELLEEREELGMAVCRGQIFISGALAADGEIRLALR